MGRERRVLLEMGYEIGRRVLRVHKEDGKDHGTVGVIFWVKVWLVWTPCDIVWCEFGDDVSFLRDVLCKRHLTLRDTLTLYASRRRWFFSCSCLSLSCLSLSLRSFVSLSWAALSRTT